MPKPYVSNSPKYLDYIASTMTREEILADDNLCQLLNNPYIKDNMETALAWAEAEVGGFDEKFQFVKQFLCNAPELDTDTIIHYRNIILNDEDYTFIANAYFSNIEVVDNYRINEFEKETASTTGNCLLNPCNYLDDLSLNIGILGDPRNFRTLENLFSLKLQKKQDEKQKNEPNEKHPKSEVNDEAIQGSIRPNITKNMPKGIRKSYGALMSFMGSAFSEFAEAVGNSNINIDNISTGDPNAIRNCEAISTMVKADVFSTLGDCARIWSDLRDLNYYDSEQNTVQPVETEVGGKTVQGTPSNKPKRKNDYDAANPKAKGKSKKNAPTPLGQFEGVGDLGVGNLDGDVDLNGGGMSFDASDFGSGGQWEQFHIDESSPLANNDIKIVNPETDSISIPGQRIIDPNTDSISL